MSEKPLDYVDAHGTQWIMAACGHRCGGGVKLGQQIAMCPNCRLVLQVEGSIPVVYPERLPPLPEHVEIEKQKKRTSHE